MFRRVFIIVSCIIAISARSLAADPMAGRGLASSGRSRIAQKRGNTNHVIQTITAGAAKQASPHSDSNAVIAAKKAVFTILEASGLLGVIKLGKIVSEKTPVDFPYIAGTSIPLWTALIFVIFSSSTVKSWVDGGVGAATQQVLKPNVVPGDGAWYATLKKPWFNPPGWVFPIMWLIVSKPTQLIAVSKVMKQSEGLYWPALAVYCTHLSLGDTWNDVFFGCQRIGLGAIVIIAFYGFLLASTKLFWTINPDAGIFMLPTCGWVFVATALNLSIYSKNPFDSNESRKGKNLR